MKRISTIKTLALACLALELTSCASLKSVSMTQVPRDRGRPIQAEATNWALLGIHFTNDFVDDAIEDLQKQCPGGRITGVYTKYDGHFYFLVTRRRVRASGYCETPNQKGAKA